MLIFVPLAPADLAAWASGAARDLRGHAATPTFLRTFGLTGADDEETDLTLAAIASLQALLLHGRRLVAVVETQAAASGQAGIEAEFGVVVAAAVPFTSVTSLFADDAETAERAEALRTALGPGDLGRAWDDARVEAFLAENDLSWHGTAEWERLTH